jgi:broad specificity phosphatase PhoE
MADPESSAHRAWRPCDVTVVKAWIDGRFDFAGESFAVFERRVREALLDLPSQSHVAVVSSATPIALSAGAALDLSPGRVMQMAGAQRNTAFSEMDLRRGDPRLVSFNNIPHLREARLITTR